MDNIKLLNLIVEQLFKGISTDEVLEFTYKKTGNETEIIEVKVGDVLLPEADVNQLVIEARMLKESYLWRILFKRLQGMAQMKMLTQAETEKDLIFPKAMIVAIKEIEEVVNKLLTLEGKKFK